MKKILGSFLIISSLTACSAEQPKQQESVAVQLKAREKRKMPVMLAYIGTQDAHKTNLLEKVKHLLAFDGYLTDGFSVAIRFFDNQPTKETLKACAKEGFSLVVFISEDQKNNLLDYRVYDAHRVAMVTGKRLHTQSYNQSSLPTLLADAVWQDLTNKPGIFASKLAYCKEEKQKGLHAKNIYVTSPFGNAIKNTHCFMRGGILLAPRWNHDVDNPLLLFSRCTNKNVCLLSATMNKECTIVSNFDGLNMLPAFSPNGEKIVYCLSLEGRSQLYSCEFNTQENRKILRRITNNDGNNLSPSVTDAGDVIFCSDFKTGKPEIFYYHVESKKIDCIAEGFCSSPNWSEATKKIAYSKAVDSYMQLFVYDLITKQHKQVTFDDGDKEESSWSPCGNYLAYCVDTKKTSRIAVMNVSSHEYAYITPVHERCSYPSWSPVYNQPLVVS